MPDRTARRLLRLLAEEHAALTQGNFDGLSQLAGRKESLLTSLAGESLAKDIVQDVARATNRNQSLLLAAMRGMTAAARTLEAIKATAKGSVVYGSDGSVSRLSRGDQRLSQKL